MSLAKGLIAGIKVPVAGLSVLTGAKSFIGNPVLGSERLNRLGLHEARVRAAARLAAHRRRALADGVSEGDRRAFHRDGFVVKPDFLPVETFAQLRAEILDETWDTREMRQGCTVTRRVFVDEVALRQRKPMLANLVARDDLTALIRYVGGTGGAPVMSIQSILVSESIAQSDPQCAIHSDTFHPTAKAWFFLHDVGPDDGPFFYVPGSHVLTPERLSWERAQSIAASRHTLRDHAEGSFRIAADDLNILGLPAPQPVTVKANTLVVADTFGFHGRTPSPRPTQRVELYATLRRNPFLPWTGLDPLSTPPLRRRMGSLLTTMDRLGIARMPWAPVGPIRLDAPPQL